MKSKRNRNRRNHKKTHKNKHGGGVNPSRLPELIYERIIPDTDKLKCTTNWITTCSKLDDQLSNIFLQIILKSINQHYINIVKYKENINILCKDMDINVTNILDQINSYRKFANKYLTYNTNVDKFNQLDMETKYILFDLVAILDSNASFLFCIQNVGNNIHASKKLDHHIQSSFKNSTVHPIWYTMAKYLFSPVSNNQFKCVCDAAYFLIHDTKEPQTKTKTYYCSINWKLASYKDITESTGDTVNIYENYIYDTPKNVVDIYKQKYLKTSPDYDPTSISNESLFTLPDENDDYENW